MDPQYKGLIKAREDNSLSLRKNEVSKSLIRSKLSSILTMNLNDKSYEIDISILNIDKQILESFDRASISDKLAIAYKEMNSNQMNRIMYGMKQMRNYTDTMEEDNSNENHSLITIEAFNLIYHFLTSKNNLNLIYEACCSMINISCYCPFYCNKLSKEKYLSGIIDILLNQHQSQMIITTNALMIIINILELQKSSFIPILLQLMPFFDYIANLFAAITSQEGDFPMNAIAVVLWTIGSFIKYSSTDVIQKIASSVMKIYPLLIKLISNNINQEIFTEGIICLNWIIEGMKSYPQIISIFNDYNIYPHLNMILASDKTKTKLTKIILSIFTNVTLMSDDAIKQMASDSSLYSSIESILLRYIGETKIITKKNEVVALTYKLLNNCALIRDECNDIMRNTKIVEYTMTILDLHKSNHQLISDILLFLSIACDINDSRIKMELLRFPIIEYVVSQLNNNYESSLGAIKENCLKIITTYLAYGDTLTKNRNIIKEELELMNLPDILTNLQANNSNGRNKNIDNAIDNIYNKYYNTGTLN